MHFPSSVNSIRSPQLNWIGKPSDIIDVKTKKQALTYQKKLIIGRSTVNKNRRPEKVKALEFLFYSRKYSLKKTAIMQHLPPKCTGSTLLQGTTHRLSLHLYCTQFKAGNLPSPRSPHLMTFCSSAEMQTDKQVRQNKPLVHHMAQIFKQNQI